MENLAPRLIASAGAVAALGGCAAGIDALDDVDLLEGQRLLSALRRLTEAYGMWFAAAIAGRSSPDLGYSGLARKQGFVSPEALIQSVSGITKSDAVKFVQLGTVMHEIAATPESLISWQAPITEAVSAGALSVDAADAIRRGLGGLDDAVAMDDLRAAAQALVGEAVSVAVDELARRAREVRDELDAAGVARREKQRRHLRYFTVKQGTDGMVTGSYRLSDEDGALMIAIRDRAMSPALGGPRFEAPEKSAVPRDSRTPGQIVADTFTGLLRIGVDADHGKVFGSRHPAVRVMVSQGARHTRVGHGRIEGLSDPVSLETVDRFECDAGTIGLMFDEKGQVIDLGRSQRLFSERQRLALAVRDGGCLFAGCVRPPSWCEAHHIDEWQRDHGKTDLADGVLLCRLHHLLVHNNHWKIYCIGGEYWLRPPRDVDSSQIPIPLPSKNPAMHELART
jgi:hypothetical protein